MNTASIVCHFDKSDAKVAALRTIERLADAGVQVNLPEDEASHLGRKDLARPREVCAASDMVLVFGGDGTILRTVRWLEGEDTPILGVNLGQFGFLAGIELDRLEDLVEQVRQGNYLEQRRMLLQYRVISAGQEVASGHVLNDVVLGRGAQARVMRVSLLLNGEHFMDYAADGIIAATPTGSTAYSLSAGGPIVSPDCRLIVVSPVCPHTLFNRSVVFSAEDKLEIQVNRPVGFTADGQETSFDRLDSVLISASDRSARLVQLHENAFYRILRDKLRINQPIYRR